MYSVLILNSNTMKRKLSIYTGIAGLIIGLSGCTSYVENINVDPDNLTNIDSKNLFQGVLLADQFFHTSSVARDAMIWMNMANGENRQYVALNNWNNTTASEFDDSWNTAYVNCITQAKLAQEKADQEVNPRLKGAMQVIEAHCMGTVTSLWGDVPYSEIDIHSKNLTPKYDSQASVYARLQALLDDAITNLNSQIGVGIPIPKGQNDPPIDIFYKGDAGKWIKLAYSLKARYYLHVKNYPLAKQNALLGISSVAEDLNAQFGNSSYQNFNPYYSFLVYDRDDYMSGDSYAARLIDSNDALYRGNAKTNEAARFAYNYQFESDYFSSTYMLNIFGGDYGGYNGKFGSDTNMPLVTYGEMLLIIAESDARTSFTDGLTSYNNYRNLINSGYSIGIGNNGYSENYPVTPSYAFAYDAYDPTDFDAGGLENNTATGLTNQQALLREILEERYVYFIGSFEAFTDFGRTNNQAEIQLKTGYAGTPQRFIYPQVEINSNPNTPSPLPSITTKTPVHN